jgi:hypothetical protein
MSLQASNQEIMLVATAGLGIGVVLGALWSPLPDATLTARLCRLQQRLLASVGLASVPANGVLSSSSSINGTFHCATTLGMLFFFCFSPCPAHHRNGLCWPKTWHCGPLSSCYVPLLISHMNCTTSVQIYICRSVRSWSPRDRSSTWHRRHGLKELEIDHRSPQRCHR